MIETIIFIFGSLFIIWISVPSLHRPGSHGYYRFFAWEIILGLFVANLHDWFVNPYAWNQIISWILLLVSLIPLILGVIQMRTIGRPSDGLEATTQLVKTGIFRFIRHPMYASLLYLAWGIYFKSPSLLDGCLVIVTSVFLFATAVADEAECSIKFGKAYKDYMQHTKRFLPFIF